MEKLMLKKEEVKRSVKRTIRMAITNSHLYKRDGYSFIYDSKNRDGCNDITADSFIKDYFKHADNFRSIQKCDPYTAEEKEMAEKMMRHYWMFYIDKLIVAEKKYKDRYEPMIKTAQKMASTIPWREDAYCGSAIVYFPLDTDIGKTLCYLKELETPKHWSSRMFAASVNVPAKGQSLNACTTRALAMVNFFESKGIPAKMYSYAD